jgi:cell division transport system ATP-binding protein
MSVLSLQNATIHQKDRAILNEVSVKMERGEICYLVGKTGSGKSSLLKTLYGALPLKNGAGEVAGFNLKEITRSNLPFLRRKIGIVFQDFNLLDDRSVYENLRFVLQATGWKDENAMQARIKEVLNLVNIAEKAEKMPHLLSGGEQQRVVIARALLNKPELILADEPTGNLDPETSDDILLLLLSLSKHSNTAVLCATHDYRLLENFPARIIRIQNGRLIDEESFLV